MTGPAYGTDKTVNHYPFSNRYGEIEDIDLNPTRLDGTSYIPPFANIMSYNLGTILNKEQRLVIRTALSVMQPDLVLDIIPSIPNKSFLNKYIEEGSDDGTFITVDSIPLETKHISSRKAELDVIHGDLANLRLLESTTVDVTGEMTSQQLRCEDATVTQFLNTPSMPKGMYLEAPNGDKYLLSINSDGELKTAKI